jgi:hypothetical protein
MKYLFSALLLPLSLPAQLVSDQHWFYDYPQMTPEPFAFTTTDTHLYAGGLFLSTDGVSNGKNLARFSFATETWEQVPGATQGADGRIDVIYKADDGLIYLGGNFRTVANISTSGIASFNPATGAWKRLFDPNGNLTLRTWDDGPRDGRTLAIVKSGNFIYAGGNFTNAAAPTNERYLVRFNLTTQAWGPVGNGTGGQVDDLELLPNGDILAATRNDAGLMRWNGSSWSTYAGGIGSGIARCIEVHPDGRVFVAGDIDTVGSANLATRDVAAYNPATNSWSNLNGGFDQKYIQSNGTDFDSDGIYDMVIDASGNVYVGGDIQADDARTDLNLNHIAMWNDTGAWRALGSGLGSTGSQIVNCLALGPNQDLYAGGTFSLGWLQSKSATTQFARWDSSQVLTPVPATFRDAILTNEEGMLYLSARTIPGEQYQIRKSSDPAFTSGSDVGGRRSGGNFGIKKWELGPAPSSGSSYFRVETR